MTCFSVSHGNRRRFTENHTEWISIGQNSQRTRASVWTKKKKKRWYSFLFGPDENKGKKKEIQMKSNSNYSRLALAALIDEFHFGWVSQFEWMHCVVAFSPFFWFFFRFFSYLLFGAPSEWVSGGRSFVCCQLLPSPRPCHFSAPLCSFFAECTADNENDNLNSFPLLTTTTTMPMPNKPFSLNFFAHLICVSVIRIRINTK